MPDRKKFLRKTPQPCANCFRDECGKAHATALFHGYHFGDRLLEGVYFRARVLEDGRLQVETVDNPATHNYLKGLNMDYWLDLALDYALEEDVFMGDGIQAELTLETKEATA